MPAALPLFCFDEDAAAEVTDNSTVKYCRLTLPYPNEPDISGQTGLFLLDRPDVLHIAQNILPAIALIAQITERDIFTAQEHQNCLVILDIFRHKVLAVKVNAADELTQRLIKPIKILRLDITSVPVPDMPAARRAAEERSIDRRGRTDNI